MRSWSRCSKGNVNVIIQNVDSARAGNVNLRRVDGGNCWIDVGVESRRDCTKSHNEVFKAVVGEFNDVVVEDVDGDCRHFADSSIERQDTSDDIVVVMAGDDRAVTAGGGPVGKGIRNSKSILNGFVQRYFNGD